MYTWLMPGRYTEKLGGVLHHCKGLLQDFTGYNQRDRSSEFIGIALKYSFGAIQCYLCFTKCPFSDLLSCESLARQVLGGSVMHFCGLLPTRIFPSPPAVNGYLYGNLPGLSMCKNDKVSWHLIGLGSHYDMHGVHFQGNTIDLRGTTRDGLALFPHLSGTALMQPDRVGMFMN